MLRWLTRSTWRIVASVMFLVVFVLPFVIPYALIFVLFKDVHIDNFAIRAAYMLPVAAVGLFLGGSIFLKFLAFHSWVETKYPILSDLRHETRQYEESGGKNGGMKHSNEKEKSKYP